MLTKADIMHTNTKLKKSQNEPVVLEIRVMVDLGTTGRQSLGKVAGSFWCAANILFLDLGGGHEGSLHEIH